MIQHGSCGGVNLGKQDCTDQEVRFGSPMSRDAPQHRLRAHLRIRHRALTGWLGVQDVSSVSIVTMWSDVSWVRFRVQIYRGVLLVL
jgi:hypothetical protein